MSHSYSPMSKQRDESVGAPSLRGNRSASLALTAPPAGSPNAGWQDVLFTGTSAYNRNLFPLPIATTTNLIDATKPMVHLDAAGRLLRFQGITGKVYDLTVNSKVSSSNLVAALNLVTSWVQLRFVIPSPTPVYFPLPDIPDGCTDFCPVGLVSQSYPSYTLPIRLDANMQQYGLGVQMRLSNAPVGTATVNAADLILYGR